MSLLSKAHIFAANPSCFILLTQDISCARDFAFARAGRATAASVAGTTAADINTTVAWL